MSFVVTLSAEWPAGQWRQHNILCYEEPHMPAFSATTLNRVSGERSAMHDNGAVIH